MYVARIVYKAIVCTFIFLHVQVKRNKIFNSCIQYKPYCKPATMWWLSGCHCATLVANKPIEIEAVTLHETDVDHVYKSAVSNCCVECFLGANTIVQ